MEMHTRPITVLISDGLTSKRDVAQPLRAPSQCELQQANMLGTGQLGANADLSIEPEGSSAVDQLDLWPHKGRLSACQWRSRSAFSDQIIRSAIDHASLLVVHSSTSSMNTHAEIWHSYGIN